MKLTINLDDIDHVFWSRKDGYRLSLKYLDISITREDYIAISEKWDDELKENMKNEHEE